MSVWRPIVVADLMSEYGIDTESGVLSQRSWPWMLDLIEGLLTCDSRLYRHFKPEDKPTTK